MNGPAGMSWPSGLAASRHYFISRFAKAASISLVLPGAALEPRISRMALSCRAPLSPGAVTDGKTINQGTANLEKELVGDDPRLLARLLGSVLRVGRGEDLA